LEEVKTRPHEVWTKSKLKNTEPGRGGAEGSCKRRSSAEATTETTYNLKVPQQGKHAELLKLEQRLIDLERYQSNDYSVHTGLGKH
jgi:hypothetical protein